jgi:hypothetical protein
MANFTKMQQDLINSLVFVQIPVSGEALEGATNNWAARTAPVQFVRNLLGAYRNRWIRTVISLASGRGRAAGRDIKRRFGKSKQTGHKAASTQDID